jgi:hypothetical protein
MGLIGERAVTDPTRQHPVQLFSYSLRRRLLQFYFILCHIHILSTKQTGSVAKPRPSNSATEEKTLPSQCRTIVYCKV